jgi:uncharacterized protein YjbI with pentapeptide repeats
MALHSICDEKFDKEDFTLKELSVAEYDHCTFINCNFQTTNLSEMRFIECEFIDCNMSNANLIHTSFQDTHFLRCKLYGLRFEDCNDFAFAVSFDECQLNHSSFYQMKLKGMRFKKSMLEGVDFAEADLYGTSLYKCNLLHAAFDNTNLENADLRHSINYSIDPVNNRIKGAQFSSPEVLGLLDKFQIKVDL